MKTTCTLLILFSTLIFSQTFIDVSYNNSDPANSTDLSLIQKITFSGTEVTFLLTDATSVTKALSIINKITFGAADNGNPLPVELVSFTAAANGNEVTLKWSTATEVDNYGFEIERSQTSDVKSETWERIGFVEGHGNSNSPKEYWFTDIPKGGTSFQYRLKQIDTDGKYSYSTAISVDIGLPNQYALNQNYPNPFNPSTKIAYSILKDGLVTLKVYDALGREVASLVNENKKAGNYEVSFAGGQLTSGVYFSRLTSANYTGLIKMLLVK